MLSCEFHGISLDLAEDYCWIHGSTYIPREYQVLSSHHCVRCPHVLLQPHLKCIVDQEGFTSEDDSPDTAFYQWVTFIMAIQVTVDNIYTRVYKHYDHQAAIFYLPYQVWSMLEGGLLRQFGTEGGSRVMLGREVRAEDGAVVREAVVEKFVKYFKSIFHHNTSYFASYVFCE